MYEYSDEMIVVDGKVVVNGEEYRSEYEYLIMCDLKKMERDGKISELKRRVKYVLIPAQRDETGKLVEYEVSYIADFEYIENGEKVVMDVKRYARGSAFQLFSIKRKLMLYNFGIKIKLLNPPY